MSSGMGIRGTVGRCYGFWQDFLHCMVRACVRQRKTGGLSPSPGPSTEYELAVLTRVCFIRCYSFIHSFIHFGFDRRIPKKLMK